MGRLVSDVGTDVGSRARPQPGMRLSIPVFEERSMTIAADPGRLAEARDWAHRAAEQAGLGEADAYQVRLAVSEAVANAIQHGSQSSGDSIRIAAFESDGSLVFEVRDGGTFVAPLSRATIDDESGRGLELLTLMMDEVHISSTGEGSLLRFAKRLDVR
jgi:anti-sigma regulatory factor (Ser/Thr protein kinase)